MTCLTKNSSETQGTAAESLDYIDTEERDFTQALSSNMAVTVQCQLAFLLLGSL